MKPLARDLSTNLSPMKAEHKHADMFVIQKLSDFER
jgi:hypothetical protein